MASQVAGTSCRTLPTGLSIADIGNIVDTVFYALKISHEPSKSVG